MKDFTEKEVSSEMVYEGRLFDVKKDIVALPDGKTSDREYIVHPGAVMVVPLIEPASVVLERQYRYPLHDHFYELPAGKIEPGEDPALTAKRELLEETGYVAGEWRYLGRLHPSVGYSDEVVELYFASRLRYQEQKMDEGEFLEVLTLPLEEAFEWVKAKKITEVKTILGLMWLDRILQGRE
ncbi:MAG: NUDIX domain-containing protein [Burkholderiales bacterium]